MYWLADLVVGVHLLFVLFAVLGGLLVLRWPRIAWIHIPSALWAGWIELVGWVCPLTPLENWLRQLSGEAGYGGGFVSHYLLPLLYPAALTREIQIGLGMAVILLNLLIYAWVLHRVTRRQS